MLQEERAALSVESIVQALQDLLESNDFASITMEDIIQRSRLSRPTVYKYFASKEAILARLGSEVLYTLAENLIDHHEWDGDAREKLSFLYRVLSKELRAYKATWHALATSGAYYHKDMLDSRKYLDRFITAIITQGQHDRQITKSSPAIQLATTLSALQTTICVEWCLGYPTRTSLSKRLLLGLDSFFEGVAC